MLPEQAILHAILADCLCDSTPPSDLSVSHVAQVMDDFSRRSFRLLATAIGVIPDVDQLDLPRMTQQQVESCTLSIQLSALVVLTNSIRPDSKDTISEVQEGYAAGSLCGKGGASRGLVYRYMHCPTL